MFSIFDFFNISFNQFFYLKLFIDTKLIKNNILGFGGYGGYGGYPGWQPDFHPVNIFLHYILYILFISCIIKLSGIYYGQLEISSSPLEIFWIFPFLCGLFFAVIRALIKQGNKIRIVSIFITPIFPFSFFFSFSPVTPSKFFPVFKFLPKVKVPSFYS